jgi:hypothetical protein
LILIFYTAVFTHFSLFSKLGCYNVSTEFGNVPTGNGHDHITQAQVQLDGLNGADTDQSGRESSLSGKPSLRPQAGRPTMTRLRVCEFPVDSVEQVFIQSGWSASEECNAGRSAVLDGLFC